MLKDLYPIITLKIIVGTLPTSEYTAYSENKGRKNSILFEHEENNDNNDLLLTRTL